MAQTNYTPISLYYSTTASAVPTAANLVPGELAINTNDGKLYYEDSSGVVQVLATKSTGSIGGSNTQVQFNNSGSLGGSSSFTWDGTTVTATKFAGALNGTVGATTASTGAFTTLSTSSTTTLSGLTASTALALDASKNVVSVTNTGTGNNVLSASPTLTGTIAGASLSLSSLTSGRVTYATTSGLLTNSSNLTFDGTNLTVVGQITANNTIFSNGGFSGQGAYVQRNSTGGATLGSLLSSGSVTFETNLTTAMTILSSGNVGIGTSSPNTSLEVSATGQNQTGTVYTNINAINSAKTLGLSFGYDTANGGVIASGGVDKPIAFWQYSTSAANYVERMRIDSSGNLLVGNTTVTNNAKVESFYNGNTFNGFVANDTSSATGSGFFICSLNGTNIGSITRVAATSAVVYNTTSDQRLKSNIVDASPVLDKLMNVKVRQFDWTDGNLHQDAGFIAQELAPVLSGIVTEGKTEEDMWQMDYSRLTPYLVKAIQELKAEFDAYKAIHP
jgi:hypothetical protein